MFPRSTLELVLTLCMALKSSSRRSSGGQKDTFLINSQKRAIYGNDDKDSVNITGSLYGATVDLVRVTSSSH